MTTLLSSFGTIGWLVSMVGDSYEDTSNNDNDRADHLQRYQVNNDDGDLTRWV